ncbi:MAG: iron ABC transporter permease [Actinomycetota bacterium]
MVKNRSQAALWIAPLFFFGLLFYLPLGKILSIGFSGDWLQTLTASKTYSILWFTFWQAVCLSHLALGFGIPGAYVLYHRKFRGQEFLRAFITVPFVLPTIVVAIGFTSFQKLPIVSQLLTQNSGVPIIICANVFMNYSLAVRIIGGVWMRLDNSIEDAASLDGAGRFRTLISITLPQLKDAIASAAALIFLYCAANFGLALVLGGATTKTLETEIYISATQFLDLPKSAALVGLQTLLTIIAFLVAQRYSGGQFGFGIATAFGQRQKLDRRDFPAAAITAVFISVLIAIPLISVVVRALQFDGSFSITNFHNLASHGARDVLSISVGHSALNTVRNAAIATVLSMVIGVIAAYILSHGKNKRTDRNVRKVADIVFQLPLGISSVVLGFGYLITFGSGLFPLRSSWLVTPIAQSLISIPLVIRLLLPAFSTIESDLLETAETDAATPSQIWWLVEGANHSKFHSHRKWLCRNHFFW